MEYRIEKRLKTKEDDVDNDISEIFKKVQISDKNVKVTNIVYENYNVLKCNISIKTDTEHINFDYVCNGNNILVKFHDFIKGKINIHTPIHAIESERIDYRCINPCYTITRTSIIKKMMDDEFIFETNEITIKKLVNEIYETIIDTYYRDFYSLCKTGFMMIDDDEDFLLYKTIDILIKEFKIRNYDIDLKQCISNGDDKEWEEYDNFFRTHVERDEVLSKKKLSKRKTNQYDD